MGGQAPRYPKPFSVWTTYAGHGGVDYPYPAHTPIPAVSDGRITFSGWWNDRAGYTRTLTTPEGIQIMHCHLVNLEGPGVGRIVKAGDIIAYVGTTGHSTGNHLHQEIWINGVKQSGDAYWRIIDKARVVSAQESSGSGSAKPSANLAPSGGGAALKTKEYPMFDALYVKQTDGQKPDKDRIFAIFRDPRTGELVKDHIKDGALWSAIEWGLKRRGVTITSEGMKAAELNKIPTWKK